MLEREKRLNEVYDYLRSHFGIHTKGGFADSIKYARAYISSAMNGNEKYLTDKLFENICEAYPGVFNLDYLLTGEGDLLTIEEDVRVREMEKSSKDSMVNETIEALKKQIAILEKRIEDKDTLLRMKDKFISILEYQLDMSKRDSSFHNQPASLMASDPVLEPEK